MKWLAFLLIGVSALFAEPVATQDAVKAYQAGDWMDAKTQFDQILASDPKNQIAKNYLKLINEKVARQIAAQRKLESIVIPRLDLKDASAREAFEYLIQIINKSAPEGYRANLVWVVPADYAQRVTLSLEGVPATAALKYTAETAGLRASIEEFAIRVSMP